MDFKEAYQDTCSTVAFAARTGNIKALKALISKGKPYDVKDNRGWTCVHEAASWGHVECLDTLLELDEVDIEARTFEWETALILASTKGHKDCVVCLIGHGADLNAHTHDMDSSLTRAVKQNHLDCVNTLLESGADVNQKYFTDDSPLHIAIGPHCNMDMVSCLVEAGADLLSGNEHAITPVFIAAQFGLYECLKFLIKKLQSRKGMRAVKKYIEMSAYDFATPLYVAVQGGYSECAELLLHYGADPLKGPINPEDDALTIYPMQAAISENYLRCFQLLSDSLDAVLKRYDFQRLCREGVRKETITYHPFILAQEHNDAQIFQELWNKIRASINNGLINVFEHKLSLPAAVMFMKYEKTWTLQKYDRHLNGTGRIHDLHIFVAAMNSGRNEHVIGKLHFDRRFIVPSFLDDWSHNFGFRVCLMKKYLKGCCLGESCPVSCNLHVTNSDLLEFPYVMLLCLSPFVSSIEKIRGLKEEESNDESCCYQGFESRDEAKQIKDNISKVLVSNSLQHNCRIAIVFQLVKCNNYYSRTIDSLELPDILKNYIKYKDFGVVGQNIVEGFALVADTERLVNKTYEETVFP